MGFKKKKTKLPLPYPDQQGCLSEILNSKAYQNLHEITTLLNKENAGYNG